MASRWRTGATHIKVVRRPPEERPWPRSPSHNGAGLRGLGGGRGEPQSARRPPRARTVAVGRDVRGDAPRSAPDGADVLHRAGQHGDGVGGPRRLAGHRPSPPRPRTGRRADRHRPRRRALRPAAHGPRAATTHRVRASPRGICPRGPVREGNRSSRRADRRRDARLPAPQEPLETGGPGVRGTLGVVRPPGHSGGGPPDGPRARNFLSRGRIPTPKGGDALLKECRSHGYFREELCPHCGSEGKFLLNDEEVEILGRTMAGVLRHFPERYGLEMDAHGWVDLRDFLTAVQIRNRRFRFVRQHHVVGLIETDPKGRYQFEDGKMRATYGHSKDLDLDLPTEGIPDVLFYPTTEEESHLLKEAGLRPSDRKMVHLSATFEAALEAGRVRIAAPVILEIDAKAARSSGVVIHKAGKTVYTSKEVPGEFLRRSHRVEEELPPQASADSTE